VVARENNNLHGSILFLATKMATEFELFFTKEKEVKNRVLNHGFLQKEIC
jgi:hypothetical protein